MNLIYIYQSESYCEDCGSNICEDLKNLDKAPDDPENESLFDSNDYPKKQYGNHEADYPITCASCEEFLENDLTDEGRNALYIRIFQALQRCANNKDLIKFPFHLQNYINFYNITLDNIINYYAKE